MRSLLLGSLPLMMVAFFAISSQGKGTKGAYSSVINDGTTFQNPNQGKVLDQDGTIWQTVDDISVRQMDRTERISYNASVTASTTQANNYTLDASSSVLTSDQINWGWALAVPTASVTNDQFKTKIYNYHTNTAKMYMNIATGSVTGLALTYPSTNTWIADVDPGETYEWEGSSFTHLVVKSSHSVATESFQATQCR